MISTYEKELAIEMWTEIRENLEFQGNEVDCATLEQWKEQFCTEHNLRWQSDCVLCEEFRQSNLATCSADCPLMKRTLEKVSSINCGCSSRISTDYSIAMNDCYTQEFTLAQRLKAIDNIINAIREVKTVDESGKGKER